jgi:quercetin dioxygenase-like cupin family protein
MHVTNLRGLSVELLVGPEHGATRIFIWCVAAQSGEIVGVHHHEGEEIIRVLYGRLLMRVDDATRELSAGEVVILTPGTVHAYRALEDSEIEVYGEIGAGEFLHFVGADGADRIDEVFMAGAPWSRTPSDPSQYSSHKELLNKYRETLKHHPLEAPAD